MNELIELSRAIKREADRILLEDGLEEVLCRYGEVKYVGSYELDLMLKKDIDISLINPTLEPNAFHQLALDVSFILRPHSMHFRNTRIKPIKYRPPDALYWAFAFRDWNIDLWLVDEGYYRESVRYMDGVKSLLTDRNKMSILEIKNHALASGEYGRRYGSREIYHAVLECGIRSGGEFNEYLKRTNA